MSIVQDRGRVTPRRRLPDELTSLTLTAAERAALRGQGFGFYDWELIGDAARFVVRWDQDPAVIDRLASAISAL